MSDSFQLAKMVLRSTFATRHFDPSPLGRLLARHCRDEGEFEGVESAVLLNWSNGPVQVARIDADGEEAEIVSRVGLDELIGATLREVLRLSRGVRCEIGTVSLPRFADRTLHVGSESVGPWRDQDIGNRAQIDILEAFERAGWPSSIPCPDHADYSFGDACKNLTRKLNRSMRNPLRFRHSGDLIFCSRA